MSRYMDFQGHEKGSAKRYSLRIHGVNFQLSPHFRLIEFASRDGADEVLVHPALVDLLETVREEFGEPIHVTSGYRSPSHNRAVGGARDSRHTMGLAADVIIKRVSPSDIAEFAAKHAIGGLGTYSTFCHLDVEGHNRRWSG